MTLDTPLSPSANRPLTRTRVLRVNVVGASGAGKTTLARELGERLGVPHVELDPLRHGPNWTETPDDRFREQVDAALSGDGWTVDGNYSMVRDLIWGRAQMVVWLDYSFPLVMARLFRRTMRRVITQEELWNGNRESFRLTFLSRDSILLWGLTSYHRQRKRISGLIHHPNYAHVEFIRLRSPAEAERWLSQLAPPR